MKVEMAK
jgi:hypothetical protein